LRLIKTKQSYPDTNQIRLHIDGIHCSGNRRLVCMDATNGDAVVQSWVNHSWM